MITIETFTEELARSIEQHSSDLQNGELFLPEYLKGKVFTSMFVVVMKTLSRRLNMRLEEEFILKPARI